MDKLEQSSIKIMANTVKLCSVLCIICLWGQPGTYKLYQALIIRSVYRFHVYYHVRRVLKRLQALLSHDASFNAADNPYTESEFLKICEDYRVPNNPMKYRDE